MKIFILQLCLFKCLLWIDLIHAQLPTCQPVSSLSLKEKWILSVYCRSICMLIMSLPSFQNVSSRGQLRK